ncbi:MAG: DUF4276 family protein [Lautropia sp.]|nr:DUF4276 family protein [Lautropia sp.]
MIRVCIVCEGQTEVEFVRSCIAPHLLSHTVLAYPSLLRAPSGRHRGGRVTVERLVRFLSREYRHADRLTTLVDLYGFQDRQARSADALQNAILAALKALQLPGFRPEFVIPYVQRHEFEALLFSDVEHFGELIDGWDERTRQRLQAVQSAYENPEDINDSPETAPSRRLLDILPPGSYRKTLHGPLIAESIGLPRIRQRCPRFDQWISMLEQWGAIHC